VTNENQIITVPKCNVIIYFTVYHESNYTDKEKPAKELATVRKYVMLNKE
jgi:hypothetical protein